MEEVDKFNNLLVLLVVFLAGGLVGIGWLTMLPLVGVAWFFLGSFHSGSKNKLADGANILFLLAAIAIGLASQIM